MCLSTDLAMRVRSLASLKTDTGALGTHHTEHVGSLPMPSGQDFLWEEGSVRERTTLPLHSTGD